MNNKINISRTFVLFLIASFFIWALINLSKEYTSKTSYTLIYQDLPQNKLWQEEPQKELLLLIKGSGFKLLSSKFSSKKIRLTTDKLVNKKETSYYLLTANQKKKIQDQLPKALQLVAVLQDTIHLKIGRLASKKVPVVLKSNLNFNAGYALANQVKITPDSITVSGPFEQIKTISSLVTSSLELNNIIENFSQEISLNISEELNNVRFSHQKVTVKGIVDKFTEGEFEVPVTIENLSFGTELNIFPKKVNLKFKVGLKDFGKITPDSFKVICDFKEAQESGLNYFIPKIEVKSNLVSSIKIVPSKIEYLIHK